MRLSRIEEKKLDEQFSFTCQEKTVKCNWNSLEVFHSTKLFFRDAHVQFFTFSAESNAPNSRLLRHELQTWLRLQTARISVVACDSIRDVLRVIFPPEISSSFFTVLSCGIYFFDCAFYFSPKSTEDVSAKSVRDARKNWEYHQKKKPCSELIRKSHDEHMDVARELPDVK